MRAARATVIYKTLREYLYIYLCQSDERVHKNSIYALSLRVNFVFEPHERINIMRKTIMRASLLLSGKLDREGKVQPGNFGQLVTDIDG